MPIRPIPDQCKIELAAELLRKGEAIQLKAHGTSMLPAIWPGDVLTIEHRSDMSIAVGEIVVSAIDDRIFIHRLLRRDLASEEWITRGDCLEHDDPAIREAQIIGRVIEIRRYHRAFAPHQRCSLFAKAQSLILRRSDLIRGIALRVHAFLQNRAAKRRLVNFDYIGQSTPWGFTMSHPDPNRSDSVSVTIGGMPITLRTKDPSFRQMLQNRYQGFLDPSSPVGLEFRIDLHNPREASPDADVEVSRSGDEWTLRRGDFQANWNVATRRGTVQQSMNPYAIDSVLRIVHTLILAKEGGFLIHAASAIRNGHAFIFSGISGAGKTTISRLAPPDVELLTDEISYLRPEGETYHCYGTPFAGELARNGVNISAPAKTLFFLEKGAENRIDSLDQSDALRLLLRNTLFFAEDPDLVTAVFRAACVLVERVSVRRLTFFPDARIWDLIR